MASWTSLLADDLAHFLDSFAKLALAEEGGAAHEGVRASMGAFGGGGEIYGVAMYYFIVREASLQHDSKTAAENLAAAQSKGLLLRLKNLPGEDRDL